MLLLHANGDTNENRINLANNVESHFDLRKVDAEVEAVVEFYLVMDAGGEVVSTVESCRPRPERFDRSRNRPRKTVTRMRAAARHYVRRLPLLVLLYLSARCIGALNRKQSGDDQIRCDATRNHRRRKKCSVHHSVPAQIASNRL